MRSASALRFSKGCSSLNLERMLTVGVNCLMSVSCRSTEVDEVVKRCCRCRRLVMEKEKCCVDDQAPAMSKSKAVTSVTIGL